MVYYQFLGALKIVTTCIKHRPRAICPKALESRNYKFEGRGVAYSCRNLARVATLTDRRRSAGLNPRKNRTKPRELGRFF
jgi:hypothetical protein